ncbi:MAG: DUF1592 domain-containing protein [Pseudomonadales bacterium]|nr:DUF1592 domain-containing protein [Pseudomonadales bacterium]
MASIRQTLLFILGAALLLAACSSPSPSPADSGQPAVSMQTSASTTMPAGHDAAGADLDGLLDEYCAKCHNFEDYAGGIDLEGLSPANIQREPEVGEKVIKRLRAGMMPPVGEERPDVTTLQALAAALENQIDTHADIKPGRPGLHRLNRTEYQNAIRDLFGLDINAADFLPSDDSSNGFDNQAGALTLSPALLEAYLSAAASISQLAVGLASGPTQTLYRVAEDANQNFRIEGLPFGTRGGIKFEHNFPVDGDYNFKTFAITLGNMGNDRPFGSIRGEKLQVLIDGERVKVFDWDKELGVDRSFAERTDDEAAGGQTLPTLDVMLPVKAGLHEIGITFVATNFAPVLDMNNDFERSTIETGGIPGFTWFPHVGSVRVEGPYNPGGVSDTPSRRRLYTCQPGTAAAETDCAREIVSVLAERAFRGYSDRADIAKLLNFFEMGRNERGSFDEGIALVIQRVLSDPKFIYRIEQEPEQIAVGESYAISDLDLASRLSFFLWSSIPDQTLLDLARAGSLSQPEVLEEQVRRMLDDPKSGAFTRNFAGQWLALRNLDDHAPVVNQFPDFDDLLRTSFKRETELLVDSLIHENRPLTEILTADYTFVNERLALHYGIPGIKGARFRRVRLDGELALRAGILGKGSSLTVTSQPVRTSPVKRGYWVLASILGVEPPPPPPNVKITPPEQADGAGNGDVPSMREWMEGHRPNPPCSGCHNVMDPIGFALESFDAVGRFRTEENGKMIDTASELYDSMVIDNAADLKQFLLNYKESVARNVTQKLMAYALGRGMEPGDMPLVRQVQDVAREDEYRFQTLILAVVNSVAFLNNEKAGSEEEIVATNP